MAPRQPNISRAKDSALRKRAFARAQRKSHAQFRLKFLESLKKKIEIQLETIETLKKFGGGENGKMSREFVVDGGKALADWLEYRLENAEHMGLKPTEALAITTFSRKIRSVGSLNELEKALDRFTELSNILTIP